MCIQPMMPCINYKHLGWDIYNIIYAQLIGECTTLNKEGEFSMCFIDLQQKFLRDRPPELWNVIRLVKHWYQLGWHFFGYSSTGLIHSRIIPINT
ncbi:inactive 2'-5'-oligoadenylate synthase 1D-like isoform X2 [Arvicanthis niloticus]|uniref:inactive 2'-5'-oligoadenylate synthase 1D-like isoform X2 n=1 Tax=Arvicanthis niloticus TaxID=61156 RepID=UPI00402B5864